jgi:aminopeptidase-like protein
MTGQEMHDLARRLWPISRSITGSGVRQTLKILQEYCPTLTVHEVPTGTQAFDWIVPREWNIRQAYILTPAGEKICDWSVNNLHVMGYSVPVDQILTLEELQAHLYSDETLPDAIPYVTSYYRERWGFCISHADRMALKPGNYRVFIDSELIEGSLTYGQILLPGKVQDEVFLSTYICHPSMANNELSGPVVATALVRWLESLKHRFYSYRIVFIPETIGSLVYLSRHLDVLKKRVAAGFNLSCVGDDRSYSYLPSRNGDTLSDQAARHVLAWTDPKYRTYSWSDRGSDERQYCAPGIDLPIASIMRTKYGQYPEYHTSHDDLERVVTPSGLQGGFDVLAKAIDLIEKNVCPQATVLGEPQLGRRGLYPTLSQKNSADHLALMMDLLTWSDGNHSLLDIATRLNRPVWYLYPIVKQLSDHNLLKIDRFIDLSAWSYGA